VVVECRPTTEALAERIGQMIRTEVEKVRERTGGLPIRVVQTRSEAPVSVPTDTEVVRFFKMKTGHEAGSVSFASELAAWISTGAEGVIFGPGDIRDVRHDSESVAERDLRRASDLFARAIEHWCFYA
jgi:acetylornithine deacetylase/succinyl-diaminopimelate desuccinylase-like protein